MVLSDWKINKEKPNFAKFLQNKKAEIYFVVGLWRTSKNTAINMLHKTINDTFPRQPSLSTEPTKSTVTAMLGKKSKT